jgi:hypothetical protein
MYFNILSCISSSYLPLEIVLYTIKGHLKNSSVFRRFGKAIFAKQVFARNDAVTHEKK